MPPKKFDLSLFKQRVLPDVIKRAGAWSETAEENGSQEECAVLADIIFDYIIFVAKELHKRHVRDKPPENPSIRSLGERYQGIVGLMNRALAHVLDDEHKMTLIVLFTAIGLQRSDARIVVEQAICI